MDPKTKQLVSYPLDGWGFLAYPLERDGQSDVGRLKSVQLQLPGGTVSGLQYRAFRAVFGSPPVRIGGKVFVPVQAEGSLWASSGAELMVGGAPDTEPGSRLPFPNRRYELKVVSTGTLKEDEKGNCPISLPTEGLGGGIAQLVVTLDSDVPGSTWVLGGELSGHSQGSSYFERTVLDKLRHGMFASCRTPHVSWTWVDPTHPEPPSRSQLGDVGPGQRITVQVDAQHTPARPTFTVWVLRLKD